MTTTHEFAKQLLSLKDIPLLIPRVKEYDESGDLQDPVYYKTETMNIKNEASEVSEVSEAYVLSYPVSDVE